MKLLKIIIIDFWFNGFEYYQEKLLDLLRRKK
jgi:hypothetical protein